ncbi:MAG: glycosyltransferase family 4 protein, partial [Candidatus Komeilibacteria bacterium]|nr:glycosyltransferase family 4 protein [Candidatus Komeilibacteria bacterium]
VVHLHNVYHQLSPVIIKYFKDAGIPVVMTLHDFYVVSPNYSLYHQGQSVSVKQSIRQLILEKQIKNSFWISVVAAIIHKRDRQFYKMCDRFISPSGYLAGIVSDSYPHVPVEIMPNFIRQEEVSADGDYIFYGGRISPEKGVNILLQAAAVLPQYKFKIAGDGPLFDQWRQEYQLSNVEWLGRQTPSAVQDLLRHCRAAVLPSLWAENCPLILLESLAIGKPVLASDMGGISEIVDDNGNGLLFTAGDVNELVLAIEDIYDNSIYSHLRKGAISSASKYDAETYGEKIISFYEQII